MDDLNLKWNQMKLMEDEESEIDIKEDNLVFTGSKEKCMQFVRQTIDRS